MQDSKENETKADPDYAAWTKIEDFPIKDTKTEIPRVFYSFLIPQSNPL